MTTIERTLCEFREHGIMCDIGQRRLMLKRTGEGSINKDLFGIIDVVALLPLGIIGVQCCQAKDFAEHWRLLTVERADASRQWLNAGGTLLIYEWRKAKLKRGGEREVWKLRTVNVGLEDLRTSDAP